MPARSSIFRADACAPRKAFSTAWRLPISESREWVSKSIPPFRERLDSETGELLAVSEADRLGQMRTGAATGVATRYMARPDARRLCLFGSGWQAESQALAIAEVRDLERVAVYSRTPEKRRAFAEAIAPRLRVPVVPAESAEAVMDGADIVVTATSSRIPVFPGSLLRPGMHVNVVGSNSLAKAEIDIDAFRRVDRIVVDSVEQAKWESGDLLGAIETNRVRWEEMAELCEVVAGRRPGRASQDEVTLFKSNGLALEDVAAASLVYDLARERSLGRELSFWALPA
jgi:ornithine cyclodeaminase/alanine dehydrogenase-like protein (mu-crystallin family)